MIPPAGAKSSNHNMVTKTNTRYLSARWDSILTTKSGSTVPSFASNKALRSDTVTHGPNYPNYKELIKAGSNATTTLTGTRYTYKPATFFVHCTRIVPPPPYTSLVSTAYVRQTLWGSPIIFPGASPQAGLPISESEASNLALAKFVKKATEARRHFQGGVFLGELKQTIAAVRNPAKSLRRGLDDYVSTLKKRKRLVRRTAPRKRMQTATAIVADTWLESVFGWLPLISDIKDGAEALARSRIEPERPKTKFISAKGVSKYEGATALANVSTPVFVLTYESTTETYYAVKYYGAVRVFHPNSIPALAGLSLQDVVPTVWELVPWSFLADYFTNIGDIIEAACFMRSDLAWAAYGSKHASDSKVVCVKVVPADGVNWDVYGPMKDGSHSTAIVSRAPYTGSLIPSLDFEIPGFGRKWANMTALVASAKKLQPYHLL